LASTLHRAAAVGDLGTFRLRSGELVHCRIDRSGRLSAYREFGTTLVPCDQRILLDAVKLSDDPDWLTEPEPAVAEAISGD
jgi:hypothetical protein